MYANIGINGKQDYRYAADTLGRMMLDGNYIDGSWEISVYVDELGEEVKVRVLGDLTIGGLMHRIVESVEQQRSWSDHAIWWSDRNMWLLHNRTTLDQYGIQSNAKLMFRRIHGSLQVVLPCLTPVTVRVSFAARVLNVVRNICKELNIRHSEELSLSFPVTKSHLKYNKPLPLIRHGTKPLSPSNDSRHDSDSMKPASEATTGNQYGTLRSGAGTILRLQSENSLDQDRLDSGCYAECTSRPSVKTVFINEILLKPKNLIQKARLNSCWLDSSKSLLEHGIEPAKIGTNMGPAAVNHPILYLQFKYYSFYDLNMKYDAVRINQLFEQARWSILSEQFNCTEDEMVVLAAYQLQAELQSSTAKNVVFPSTIPDVSTPNFYATMGTPGTFGGKFSYSTGGHLTPVSPRSPPYSSSTMRLPVTSSPLNDTSIVDGNFNSVQSSFPVDEVDQLLNQLERSCGVSGGAGTSDNKVWNDNNVQLKGTSNLTYRGYDTTDTAEIPSLQDEIRVFRERTFVFRRYKIFWAMVKETQLYLFKSRLELQEPLFTYSLRNCSITPDICTATRRYVIKLSVVTDSNQLGQNGGGPINMNTRSASLSVLWDQNNCREEIWLRLDTAEKYAHWLAACRLASRGKTLASKVAFEKDVEATLEIIKLQVPGPTPTISDSESVKYLGNLENFCAERVIKRAKSKENLRRRITETHLNLRDLSIWDAQYKYIQAWQRLTSFGRTYFTVLFDRGSHPNLGNGNSNSNSIFSTSSDDLIAICQGRIEVISPQSGEVLTAWNFSDLRSWNVNWDTGKITLEFRVGQATFRPLCTTCKTISEFIGGYICLGQRTPEKSQEFNERLFYRLIGNTD